MRHDVKQGFGASPCMKRQYESAFMSCKQNKICHASLIHEWIYPLFTHQSYPRGQTRHPGPQAIHDLQVSETLTSQCGASAFLHFCKLARSSGDLNGPLQLHHLMTCMRQQNNLSSQPKCRRLCVPTPCCWVPALQAQGTFPLPVAPLHLCTLRCSEIVVRDGVVHVQDLRAREISSI